VAGRPNRWGETGAGAAVITYCVWAKIPKKHLVQAGRREGWSRVTGGLTKEAAELFAAQIYFQATVMEDAEPGRKVPVLANAADVTWEDDEELDE
jgi:hypothetical protein